MFGNKDGKPVDIEITESTFIDGELALKGTRLKQVPADKAMELASCGKARVAAPAAKKAAAEAAA